MFCIPSFDEMTDLTPYLNHVIPAYAGIQTVSHSANQVEGTSETGSIESFWALLKRGYIGTFHQFSWKHLHRYLAEFEARFNMGKAPGSIRLDSLLGSASGLRLTYKELIQ